MISQASRHVVISLILLVSPALIGCNRTVQATAKKVSPATVTLTEDQLIAVELTEDAEKRLGIQVTDVAMKNLPRYRVYSGEVTLPTNATVIVSSPLTGKLLSPDGQKVPHPGSIVEEKQAVLSLLPVLTPAEKIALATQLADAEGLVQQAQSQVEANRVEFDRAKLQADKGVGLGKTMDDAIARLKLSEKQLEAAVSRKKVLNAAIIGEQSSGEQKPIVIDSPQSGILRALHALPDEFVMGGTPLFEVIKIDSVWIRVPVYVGESTEIAVSQPAEVGDLTNRPGQTLVKAASVAAPPSATALSSTVDFYYQLGNTEGKLRPNQRVSVRLPLTGTADERVVPWSAIVQDINGGHWVYEKVADRKFVRRRVQVKSVTDSLAILERGPDVGKSIVTTGVAELFGTEFGLGK